MSNEPLVVTTTVDHVTTLRMNDPKRLNGWTGKMLEALTAAFAAAAEDEDTKAVVLTGTDPYYCAGVNLGAVIELQHPAVLHEFIRTTNQALFDMFLTFPKPILVAANGPAIGASVTTATLCDGIVASQEATFSTPFARLGVPAEGCSSVTFARMFGAATAQRMLGEEGWKPTGAEAHEIGMVDEIVAHDELMARAQEIASGWIARGKPRAYPAGMTRDELMAVNARESREIADAFLGAEFLYNQYVFLWSKNKRGPAAMFFALWLTRPLWSKLLPA
jgi:enoyl-CoA hydratase/carnithine racemase